MLLRRPHDLAALFRDGRARAGWSQSELAQRVGVSRQWVSLVETGKTSVEFDLVVGVLHVLGYRVYLEPADPPPRSEDEPIDLPDHSLHRPSQRTPLTRHGEPLGRERIRRRSKDDRHE